MKKTTKIILGIIALLIIVLAAILFSKAFKSSADVIDMGNVSVRAYYADNNQPVANAQVSYRPIDWTSGDIPVSQLGNDGRSEMYLIAGLYDVSLITPFDRIQTEHAVKVTAGQATNVVFALKNPILNTTISGRTYWLNDNAPISGATISITSLSHYQIYNPVVTGADGTYKFSDIREGYYDLTATLPNQGGSMTEHSIQVRSGIAIGIDFPFKKPGQEIPMVTGKITDSVTKLPIVNVQVSFECNSPLTCGTNGGLVYSDANGVYKLINLPLIGSPATFKVVYSKAGYNTYTNEIMVSYGSPPIYRDVVLNKSVTKIMGKVTLDGKAKSGVIVTLTKVGSTTAIKSTKTDSYGKYSFSDVVPGSYIVKANYVYLFWRFSGKKAITVYSGQTAIADIALQRN